MSEKGEKSKETKDRVVIDAQVRGRETREMREGERRTETPI